MKQVKLILVGGGDRGSSYLKYLQLFPKKFKLVGLAEPVEAKRNSLRDTYGVPEEYCFSSYEELLALPKMADVAMICTQDKMHVAPALLAIEQGYDLLLEKPIAPTAEECFTVAEAAKKKGVRALVCHVLRYTPFYRAVKRLLDEGAVGEITNIEHREGVGNLHYSHSYVRGNWRKLSESSPMILAKSCHDTDLLQWLTGKECLRVQSMGELAYFRSENAPAGAPMRCLDGCPHKDTCFYYAPDLYKVDTAEVKHFRAIVAKKFSPTDEEVDEILKTSPYGRCVYHCDNDVVDRQVVSMQFSDAVYATFTMSPFNKGGRVTTIMGTRGELYASMEEQVITLYDFATRKTTSLYTPDKDFDQSIAGGHGGGDSGIMSDLYELISGGKPSDSLSDLAVSTKSHLIAFAAEEARTSGKTVAMKDFIASL